MKKIKLLFTALALLCVFAPRVFAQDPVYNDFDRTSWVAKAPTKYSPWDNMGVTNGPQVIPGPEYLIDGSANTFLSLVKATKTYSSANPQGQSITVVGPDVIEKLGFTIELPEAKVFDYFRIQFRGNNSSVGLHPVKVSIYGSNDPDPISADGEWTTNKTWTLLYDAQGHDVITLPNAEETASGRTTGNIQLSNTVAYSSIKVVYKAESTVNTTGSSLQLGEFWVGKVSYDRVIYKPDSISFGDVLPAAISTPRKLVVAANNLYAPVTYQLGGDDPAAFEVTPGTWTKDGDTATVVFKPTARKLYRATLTMSSTGALEPQTISLTGNADFDLPVQISSGASEHWYYIQFERQAINGKVLTVVNPAIDGDTIKQLPLNAANANQQWKVTGTWDNYALVNKSGKSIYYVPAGEDPVTGLAIPRAYITAPSGGNDLFGFVRYNTTETWQLVNTTSTTAPAGEKYFNDYQGKTTVGYSLNNAGNQLRFISADVAGFVVPADTVELGAVKPQTSKVLNIPVAGLNLSAGINVALSGDADGVYTLQTATLPVAGDTVKVTYAPTAYKKRSIAIITLTSGAASKSFIIRATSDVGISKYYVGTAEQWGTRTDGDLVEAIPTLKTSDEVWIAAGEYEVPQISVPMDVAIYGGFAGTETSPAQRAVGSKPWEFTNATVLKNKAALVLSIADSLTVIDGITFQGTATTGRAIQNTTAKAKKGIIRNSIIKGFNSGASDGGGLNIRYKTEIYNCLITGNNSNNKGGGGYLDEVVIHDCEVTNNTTVTTGAKPIGSGNGGGGGLFLANAAGTVAYNCYIAGNTASFGGGVFLNGSKIYNSVIVDNTAISGSGIAFDERRAATAYNVTVADNHATQTAGAGVCFSADGSNRIQELYNAILYNNTEGGFGDVINIGVNLSGAGLATPKIKSVIIDDLVYYTDENPNLIITDGIEEADRAKLFVTGSWVTAETSPGKDKGFTLVSEAVINEEIGEVEVPAVYLEFAAGKDFAGRQRINGTIDIGPYENQEGLSIDSPKQNVTGNVIATKYYNLQGIEVGVPAAKGIYIKKDLLDTNKVRVTKVLVK